MTIPPTRGTGYIHRDVEGRDFLQIGAPHFPSSDPYRWQIATFTRTEHHGLDCKLWNDRQKMLSLILAKGNREQALAPRMMG